MNQRSTRDGSSEHPVDILVAGVSVGYSLQNLAMEQEVMSDKKPRYKAVISKTCTPCMFFNQPVTNSKDLPCIAGRENPLGVSAQVKRAQEETGNMCRRVDGSYTIYQRIDEDGQ